MDISGIIEYIRDGYRFIVFILSALFSLASCHEYTNIYKPLDFSHPENYVCASFKVKETEEYLFSIAFDLSDSSKDAEYQKLYGVFTENRSLPGVTLPVELYIVKDGEVFFEKKLLTTETNYIVGMPYKGGRLNVTLREIRFVVLPIGSYAACLKIDHVADFDNTKGFFNINVFNPKI
ncbi:DUF5625 family protein [Salmonella enterica]